MQKNKKQHIHFIGICGVAMSALAIAFHKKGYKVTGSDKGFYPPISTHLKDAGVAYYPGWHPEKMGTPDLVIVGNVAGSKNPEWLHVQKNNIEYKSYPEAIAEFFCTESNLVCAGTYGKTTTATLLTWIMKNVHLDINYMFGGLAVNDMPSAYLGDTDTCCTLGIFEGDEYISSRWDRRPKFTHYTPSHLLLTAVQWDHADVYPTEQSYIDAFQTLVNNVEKHGSIIIHEDVRQILSFDDIKISPERFYTYGTSKTANYHIENLTQNKQGLTFDIVVNTHKQYTYHIESPLLGAYNALNITGCFAMADELGIKDKKIIKAIASFKGIKRRLEKRLDSDITVIDDIAHSPAKASSALKTIKDIYNCHPELDSGSVEEQDADEKKIPIKNRDDSPKIIAVFEPNSGNRQQESIPGYDHAFSSATEVIIPRLTQIKRDPDKPAPLNGKSLTDVIAQTHDNTKHIADDDELVDYIVHNTSTGDVVVFLGSHGFRGMIEQLVNKISNKQNKQ